MERADWTSACFINGVLVLKAVSGLRLSNTHMKAVQSSVLLSRLDKEDKRFGWTDGHKTDEEERGLDGQMDTRRMRKKDINDVC